MTGDGVGVVFCVVVVEVVVPVVVVSVGGMDGEVKVEIWILSEFW